ncbi:30S ribosomal protein S15 [Thermoproteota archaeon]
MPEKDMGRIYSHNKGKSHSTRPTFKRSPSWIMYSQDEVESIIIKMAKDEVPPSLIGVKLRDEYGIPLLKNFIGKSVSDVLKANNLAKDIPEDLELLVKRARLMQLHLKKNHGDRKNVRSLELIEAKIHRNSKRYKKHNLLPPDWKYISKVAQLT